MSKRLFIVLAVALFSLRVLSADTNSPSNAAAPDSANTASNAVIVDLKDLMTRINDKLKAGKDTEADLADNIKEFDSLFTKYKDAPQKVRVEILLAKAQLYIQVLEEPGKALDILKQIKRDYSGLQVNGSIDDVINALQAKVDAKKIEDSLAPGMAFPDFDEKDVDGKPLSVANYKGKVVLVDFWATWCGPCLLELPQIQKAYDEYHDKGFEIIGVSLDEDKDRLQQFIKQKKMPWPQFFDGKKWENKLAVKYGVEAIPTGFLLDRNGKIIAKIMSGDELDAQIKKALKN
jgi:thiol-disulfide isomerase/thioredoxin